MRQGKQRGLVRCGKALSLLSLSRKMKHFVDYTRAAPKLMPPILLCWPTMSEANVVDMAVEVEPSPQYSVKFRYRATDDSRAAV